MVIARDAWRKLPVRLQKALRQLVGHQSPSIARAARLFAMRTAQDAEASFTRAHDIEQLRQVRAVGPKA